jgi:prepilin-type processing-associated H-X9-DG protein
MGSIEIRGGKTYKTQADTTTRSPNPYFCPSTQGAAHQSNTADPGDPTGVYGAWYDWPSPDLFVDYGMNHRLGGIWNCTTGGWDVGGIGKRLTNLQPVSRMPLFADSQALSICLEGGVNIPPIYSAVVHTPRHFGQKNMVFLDGHVQSAVIIPTSNPNDLAPYNMLKDGRANRPNLIYVQDPQ